MSNQNIEEQKPVLDIDTDEDINIGLGSRVVLYNDDWHSFDEVINQLIIAVQCSFEKARSFAFEVHVKGKAIVFTGKLQDCLRVSSVLEEIALHTQIIT
ncbi:MAG: ATP-dependent Clp protease adaptor ClpS [Ignavibacteriales bacterium]|nr:ATP-dependent Clp protease adaptor ClpS [Ignavibacteriales bacterium]